MLDCELRGGSSLFKRHRYQIHQFVFYRLSGMLHSPHMACFSLTQIVDCSLGGGFFFSGLSPPLFIDGSSSEMPPAATRDIVFVKFCSCLSIPFQSHAVTGSHSCNTPPLGPVYNPYLMRNVNNKDRTGELFHESFDLSQLATDQLVLVDATVTDQQKQVSKFAFASFYPNLTSLIQPTAPIDETPPSAVTQSWIQSHGKRCPTNNAC